ncbi:P-loop containing nucleoside triphosphate hydrolase protein [Lentithecium fluviatile CBS 122367]|uniref:P-loop containing nucleoside triphosphate hydrolase protein n=1 Tax=Lentithecium fluviatile CBS 122367 TaxID=1168545 RepID=A0A6G1JFS2_9PLEO|nr:P-loop containing nucleoside triphosphate hydrolase protein [Lentithecium fluviatile CBS 122367]
MRQRDYSVIEPELAPVLLAIRDFEAHDAISFRDLWAIYTPGSVVISTAYGIQSAFKLTSNPEYSYTGRGTTLKLRCNYIDWDGSAFIPVATFLSIYEFPSTVSIGELESFPLCSHPEQKSIRERLSRLGRRFQDLSRLQMLVYEGVAFDLTSGRCSRMGSSNVYHVRRASRRRTVYSDSNTGAESEEEEDPQDVEKVSKILSDEQLPICRPLVKGFSLSSKKWLDFENSNLKLVDWNEGIFEDLVQEPKVKDLLLSVARSQAKDESNSDDIVRGKGQGMVILLHGPSGVGRTLTAEAVAEIMKVPLYSFKAGELGRNPMNVQQTLQEAFKICKEWKAVLLLDEADVFMEQRSLENLNRNELVSIFLTSNRVKNLDEAFESRIDFSFSYKALTESSRRQVWKTFLERIPQADRNVSEQDLDELAGVTLNGREIKNIIKRAVLLGGDQEVPLNRGHLNTILDQELVTTCHYQFNLPPNSS